MNHHLRLSSLLATCSLLLFAACGEKPAAAAPKTPPAAPTAEVLARLAKADAVDGKTDKVVEKCAGCSLKMDGKPEFELVVGDYKLHFCKQDELNTFKADPNAAIMALKLPQ